MRTLGNIILILLILVLSLIGFGYYRTFEQPIPENSAIYSIPTLKDSVQVYWDSFNVPHVNALNENDLYFSVGFIHAQQRLWQMTLVQLASEGRFAEFFGKDLIEIDSYQRMLGFWRMAKKMEAKLTERERKVLQAYSDGINYWTKENESNLPIEFSLTGMKPILWTPTHSLALIRLLAWELNVSWWPELAYAKLAAELPKDKFEALVPKWPKGKFYSIQYDEWKKTGQILGDLLNNEEKARNYWGSKGSHIGSNAWVVDKTKSSTGFPILAGDPHLEINIPGKWFEMHLNLNGKNLSGAMHPGSPIFILGQNEFFAWSFTSMMADDTDFYLEKQHPSDRGQYVKNIISNAESFATYEFDRSYIKVKDGDQVVSEVKITQNGVIINDFIDSRSFGDSLLIAMRWTGHELTNEFGMMLELNYADSFEKVKQLKSQFTVPGQHMTYADKNGNIALFSMAKLPIRKHNPLLLGEGWNPEHRWNEWIPSDKMPQIINPEKGWIANANNAVIAEEYPYYIATFYEPESRFQQIEEMLTSKEQFKPSDFEEFQENVYSHHAKTITQYILPILTPLIGEDKDLKIAHTYLSNWLFNYDISSSAASIFDIFFMKFTQNTLGDEITPELFDQLTKLENVPVRVMHQLIKENENPLFDDKKTEEIENRDQIIIQSMKETILYLRETLGEETYNWRWENLHKLTLEPLLFNKAAENENAPEILKLIVRNVLSRGPYGVPGNGMTVNNGQYDWSKPFKMILGPSIRRIVDLSDLSETQSVIPGGQSGIPMSPHYNDQTELWLTGKYKLVLQNMDKVKNQEFEMTLLIPASN